MALTDVSDGSRIVDFVAVKTKVTLSRACKAGDVLCVAEDNFDDLGPGYADISAHASTIAYIPRLVAATDGKASEVITAYGAAVVKGYTSATAFKKVYLTQVSTTTGQISETAPTTTGHCASIVGMSLSTSEVLLFPAFTGSPDTIVS